MKKNILQFFLPFLYILITSSIIISQEFFNQNFMLFGVNPANISGILGIFTAPLIHSDFEHFFSNITALLLCFYIIFVLYKKVASIVFIVSYIIPGIFTWIIGRPAYHIGASGMVYSFLFFIICIGIISKKREYLALSLVILAIHGGIIWGLLPVAEKISWEYHVGGALSGILTAVLFYKFSFEKDIAKNNVSNISITADAIEITYIETKKPK